MSRKTIEVDSDMIDQSLEELSKLVIRLDKNPKKTRKEQKTIKKIQNIRTGFGPICETEKKRTVTAGYLSYLFSKPKWR
jgi:hypothetical protein